MANVLKMMTVEAIHSLRSAGLSCREIAKRLGIHRETVSRHLQLGQAAITKPASAPILPARSESVVAGFGGPTGLVQASCEASTGPPRHQASDASPWLEWLLEQRGRGLSIRRIHQDLRVEHPAAEGVSYDSVRRLLKKHGAAKPVPFRRMETPPGFEAQVDFGTGRRSSALTADDARPMSSASSSRTHDEGTAKPFSPSQPMTSSGAWRTPSSPSVACLARLSSTTSRPV